MKDLLQEGRRIQELFKTRLNEFGGFNPSSFISAIKDKLKKLGYETKEFTGTSIDPELNKLEDAMKSGKPPYAVAGTLKWGDGEEVVVSIGIKDDSDNKKRDAIEKEIYNTYKNDYKVRMSNEKQGRVLTIGIKEK